MLSGGVEADDSFLAARDRTRRHGQVLSTGTQPMLAAAGRTSGRRGREPPHRAPRDLEPRVLGHRDVPRPVDGGALVADCCLGCYRRDQLRGEVFRPQPPPRRGRPGGGGKYR